MLAIINQLALKAEFVDQVEAAFLAHTPALEQEPGFAGFRFLKALDPDNQACIIETYWQDQTAFENWKQSDHFKASHASMGAFREAFRAPPQFGKFHVSRDIALKV